MKIKCIVLAIFCCIGGTAQTLPLDSVKILQVLRHSAEQADAGKHLLSVGEQLKGIPYVANTLDDSPTEQLIAEARGVDCTTFVEVALACMRAQKQGTTADYSAYRKQLSLIRYRGGKMDGYASRLHYFSDWAKNNTAKGIVREVTDSLSSASVLKTLDFMTKHKHLYRHLRTSSIETERMKQVELSWTNYAMPYIPTAQLSQPSILSCIQDGDIIAMVSRKPDLDVVHIGLAVHQNGQLRLLHASSRYHRVLIDPQTLFQYVLNRKDVIGIRVIRPL